MIFGLSASDLEKVTYFAGYIIISVNEKERDRMMKELDTEYKTKLKNLVDEKSKEKMKELFLEAKREIDALRVGTVLYEAHYHRFAIKYGAAFEAGIGAEALYNMCKGLDLKKMEKEVTEAVVDAGAADREK